MTKTGSERLTLGRNWDYSNTTAKYLNQFLRGFYNCSWNICRAAINKAIKNNEIAYDASLV